VIEFEKEDLIVPTFLLTVFTLVLVLGTPSVDSRTVEEVVTFEVNKDHLSVFEGDELQYQEYRRDEIVCTSEVKIWEDVTVGAGSGGYQLTTPESVTGTCATVKKVEKTVVEVYGFEVVL